MTKKLTLIICICASFVAQAQQKALLWRISGHGLAQSSYVYGTIHMICPKDYFLTDSTKSALENAQKLYLELDMDDPKMMTKMQAKMLMNDNKKLKDLISEADYIRLNDYFKQKMGIGIDMMGRMKPFVLMSALYIPMLNCQPKSYEADFVSMATKNKKEVLGLETVESQMEVFDKIPYEKQAAMVLDMIKKGDASKKEFDRMITLYKAQNIKKLYKMMDASDMDFNGYEDLMLYNRNAAWIPIMEAAMATQRTFFGVGAAHLGGKKGILKLLKKQGYKVEAVR
jgi:uncharacterized protein